MGAGDGSVFIHVDIGKKKKGNAMDKKWNKTVNQNQQPIQLDWSGRNQRSGPKQSSA